MKKQIIIMLFLVASCWFSLLVAQSRSIYVFKDRYNKEVNKIFYQHPQTFKEIKIFGQYMIDPKRSGNIDYRLVETYLNKLFPDKNSSDLVCLNLEGKLYEDLKNNYQNEIFNSALENYIRLINFIKKKRPNLKVGIYGLPFTVYYKSQIYRNKEQKLDSILDLSDVLFPSLYVFYPAKQKRVKSNLEYFKKNLDIAFEYSERLNKTVIPFVWYLVHPSNKIYRLEAIPKREMSQYIDYITDYKSSFGSEVDGVVWWDTPTPYKNNAIRFNLLNRFQGLSNLNQSISYYFDMIN